MRAPLKAFRNRHVAGLMVALSTLLAGCLGGTGTDTENGVQITTRVVDEFAKPVPDVTLSVMNARSREDSVAESPLMYPERPIVTDQDGFASFILKKDGDFITMGRRGDSVIFFDTVSAYIDPGSGVLVPGFGIEVFTRAPPMRVNGRIRLMSGLQADSGRVYVFGTSLRAVIDSAGRYDLSWVPAATEKMKIGLVYAAVPAETVHVKVAVQGGSLVAYGAGGARCLTTPAGPATPADTVAGSLNDPMAVGLIAGKACRGRTGALVQVHRADAAGAPVEALGRYMIGHAEATGYGDSIAVPTACIEPARKLTERTSLRLTSGDVIVDDLMPGANCRP